jgi:hypothetical protein
MIYRLRFIYFKQLKTIVFALTQVKLSSAEAAGTQATPFSITLYTQQTLQHLTSF